MKRLIKAFFYSLEGLSAAWRDEAAFRLELALSAVMIPAAFYFAPDKISLLLMVGSVMLVLIVEMLNTAIEATINRIGSEIHPLAKKAKDTASAAVFLAAVNASIIWAVVLVG